MKRTWNAVAGAAAVLLLAACASAVKVESGDRAVGDRMKLTLEGAWNQISAPNIAGPHSEIWTMEGLAVDRMTLYAGVRDDEPIHPDPGGNDKRSFRFRADMRPEQIAALLEGVRTRDGSTFRIDRIEPADFGGGKGFRLDYTLVRKVDNVELSGMARVAVNGGEMFGIVYEAPKLVFFPRHRERVSRIIDSALIRGRG